MFLLAVTPIIRLICKKENRIQIKYLLIIFVLTASILKFVTFVFSQIQSTSMVVKIINYGLSIVNMVFNGAKFESCIILYISGWYFSTFDFSDKKGLIKAVKWVLGIVTPVVTLLLCYYKDSNVLFDIVSGYYYLPCYCLSVAIFLTFRYSETANTPNKFWDFVGRKNLGIYLIHEFFIEIIFKYFKNFIFNFLDSPWLFPILLLYIFVVYVLSFVISMLLNLLPKKIRRWIC